MCFFFKLNCLSKRLKSISFNIHFFFSSFSRLLLTAMKCKYFFKQPLAMATYTYLFVAQFFNLYPTVPLQFHAPISSSHIIDFQEYSRRVEGLKSIQYISLISIGVGFVIYFHWWEYLGAYIFSLHGTQYKIFY